MDQEVWYEIEVSHRDDLNDWNRYGQENYDSIESAQKAIDRLSGHSGGVWKYQAVKVTTTKEVVQSQRSPLTDPRRGDVVRISETYYYVSAYGRDRVIYSVRIGHQWLNGTCRVSLDAWRTIVNVQGAEVVQYEGDLPQAPENEAR